MKARRSVIGIGLLSAAIVALPVTVSSGALAESGQVAPQDVVPTLCNSGLKLFPPASDEFNHPLGQEWKVYDYSADGRRSRELAYRPDMVSVQDGIMTLSIVDEPHDVDGDGTTEWPAGGVESNFVVPGAAPGRPSCVEVRTKGFAANVAGTNVWDQNVFSAVWLQTRPPSYDTNPNPEIDIQEFFEKDKHHMALHTWEAPLPPAPPTPAKHTGVDNCRTDREDKTVDPEGLIDDCRTDITGLGDLTAGMHVFGLRREIVQINGHLAGLLTFYIDGRPTWTREFPPDSPFVTRGRHLVLSTQGNPPGGPGLAFPKVAEHDWVRTYN